MRCDLKYWGWGGALFTVGLFIAMDTSSDEAIERITLTKRGDPPTPTHTGGMGGTAA